MKTKLSLFSFRLKNFKAVQASRAKNWTQTMLFPALTLRKACDFQEADV